MAEPVNETAASATSMAERFPPFDASTYSSQLFWLIVSFALLYLAVSKLIIPRLGDIVERRRGRLADDIDAAAKLDDQAREAAEMTQLRLAEARNSARATADAARAEADKEISAESARVEAELDAKLVQAEGRIGEMRKAAMSRVDEIATDTTAAILERFNVTASPDKDPFDCCVPVPWRSRMMFRSGYLATGAASLAALPAHAAEAGTPFFLNNTNWAFFFLIAFLLLVWRLGAFKTQSRHCSTSAACRSNAS